MKTIYYLIFIIIYYSANSQGISIINIDTSNFPIMKAKFIALNEKGNQVTNLNISDFQIFENTVKREVIKVSCPEAKPTEKVSIAMSVDISSSMLDKIEYGKLTAMDLCNMVAMPPSEFALQICDNRALILQDFTTDRNKIVKLIPTIKAGGENDFIEQLLNSNTGLLNIAKKSVNKRIAIIYTDAAWRKFSEIELQDCIDTCKKYDIQFYSILYSDINIEPLGLKTSLRALSEATGGMFFDGITSSSAAKLIALRLQQLTQGGDFCEIEWISSKTCPKYFVDLEMNIAKINTKINTTFVKPLTSYAYLEQNSFGIIMWDVPPGTTKDTTIQIKAVNADFKVTEITKTNPNFSIKPTSFFLKENDSITLTITYTPIDSLINFCTFELINEFCNASIYIRCGFKGKKTEYSTFKVTHPNGGEQFGIGTDTIITWEGCSPLEKIDLSYSIDSGMTYNQISSNADSLKFIWKNIPGPASNLCLIKATLENDQIVNKDKIFGLGDLKQVLFFPDGLKIASCGSNGIFVWEVATGDTIFSFKNNIGNINVIALSPDGSTIAGSGDNNIKLWNLKSGTEIKTLSGHFDKVNSINFNFDGTKLVSCSNDHNIKIWDVKTGTEILTLTGHSNWVKSVCFSPDGLKILSGSNDQSVKLWDANNGEILHTMNGHTGDVNCVCFNPDGRSILSGSSDFKLKLWDIHSGNIIRTFSGHGSKVNCVCFNDDGSNIISGSSDNTLKIWNTETGGIINTLNGHIFEVNSVSISTYGNTILSGSKDNTIKLWDKNSGLEIKTLEGHTSSINSISLSPNGELIASANSDYSINIWNINSAKLTKKIFGHSNEVKDVIFSPDGNFIASCSADNTIKIWDAGSYTLIKTFYGHTDEVNSISYSPDGKKILSGSNDFSFKLWDIESGVEIKSLSNNYYPVCKVCISPDGSKFASLENNQLILWDATTLTKIQTIKWYYYFLNCLVFSPDSKNIAIGNLTNIEIYEVSSGLLIKTFQEKFAYIQSLCFSLDGSRILSGEDQTVKLWDVKTGELLKTMNGHNSAVGSVAYSKDGKILASGSLDGTIRIWDTTLTPKINYLEDVSDTVWSIVAPKSITKDIDMGKINVGSTKDSVIQSFIINSSNCKSRIDSIRIIGDDQNQFFINSGLPPYILGGYDSKNIELSFKPLTSGLKNAKIYLFTAVDTVVSNVRGEGIIPQLSIENMLIDFGKISVGSYKDTLAVATIRNIGSSVLTITNTKHDKPNDVDFTTISGGGSFNLAPGEIHKMTLRFSPKDVGLTNGLLDFEYDGVGSPAQISLIGEGIPAKIAVIELKIDSIQGFPGEVINIPIVIYRRDSIPVSAEAKLKIELSFNSTLLTSLDYPNHKIDDILSKITIENIFPFQNKSDTLTKIKFKVGLGNSEYCELGLSNALIIGDTASILTKNGKFKLLGVCFEGGKRLINPNGSIQIAAITPNPSEDIIEVKLKMIEDNGYKLIVVNSNGQIVREIQRQNNLLGINLEKINISDLSSGVYDLILQTESEKMSKLFLIIK